MLDDHTPHSVRRRGALHDRCAPQLLGELRDSWSRRDTELLSEQAYVRLRVLERPGAIPTRLQRLHEP
jgi:hypothetical protein